MLCPNVNTIILIVFRVVLQGRVYLIVLTLKVIPDKKPEEKNVLVHEPDSGSKPCTVA